MKFKLIKNVNSFKWSNQWHPPSRKITDHQFRFGRTSQRKENAIEISGICPLFLVTEINDPTIEAEQEERISMLSQVHGIVQSNTVIHVSHFTVTAEFLKKAADWNDKETINSFGCYLEQGQDGDPDIEFAVLYYRKVTSLFHGDGIDIARCLEYGKRMKEAVLHFGKDHCFSEYSRLTGEVIPSHGCVESRILGDSLIGG